MVCRPSCLILAVGKGAAEMKSSISRIRRAIASFSSASSRTARAVFSDCEFFELRDLLVKEDGTTKGVQAQCKKNMISIEKIPKIIMGRVKAKPLRSQ